MRKLLYIIAILVIAVSCNNKQSETGTIVTIQTNYGNIKIRLYDETPLHRDNFLKLINDSTYKDFLFHRVVKDFIIQAGDLVPDSTITTIPSEINGTYPKYFHKRGALGAPRWGEDKNPKKESDAHQFYIVTGKKFFSTSIQELEDERREESNQPPYTEEQKKVYETIGGAPHLDGEYTVFGEVVDGMDVIDKIEQVKVNDANRPLKNIRMKINIEKK